MTDLKTGRKQVNESGQEFGYKYEISESMWDIPTRLRVMEKLNVDLEVLSIGNPWLNYLTGKDSSLVVRALNEELAMIVLNHPRKFAAIGVVCPTSDRVPEEMNYAVNELGLKAFMIGTHVNGKSIVDDKYLQIFEEAEKLGVPVYVHPLARPDAMQIHDRDTLTSLIFPTETALFVKEAEEKQLFSRYPKLTVILAHMGGTISLLLGRLDRAFSLRPQVAGNIHQHIKSFYVDSVSYLSGALEYAAEFWSAGQIMFGTDYPHLWGDNFDRTVNVILESKLSSEEKEEIFEENATKLFRLQS